MINGLLPKRIREQIEEITGTFPAVVVSFISNRCYFACADSWGLVLKGEDCADRWVIIVADERPSISAGALAFLVGSAYLGLKPERKNEMEIWTLVETWGWSVPAAFSQINQVFKENNLLQKEF